MGDVIHIDFSKRAKPSLGDQRQALATTLGMELEPLGIAPPEATKLALDVLVEIQKRLDEIPALSAQFMFEGSPEQHRRVSDGLAAACQDLEKRLHQAIVSSVATAAFKACVYGVRVGIASTK